ncbi:ferritin [Rhodococcus rhodnii]|uniref:Ferritin n=2 Tax=Rhodococcus rhodnii TaxID=38312 RepID=R7WW02_9NOCA|nr:ferritin [Rhodococcus rhodnii]EOM78309.1 ferritin [Rhodococcus rhodnii LMG 5362]TXG89535.1 ferritin [Rhodococcus rhodnii]
MTRDQDQLTKFHALLQEQIRNEFDASHRYVATAVHFDAADLPRLAALFYAQSVEERNHAMMIVQYFLDRDIPVELSGSASISEAAPTSFESARDAIAAALRQEELVTEQIVALAKAARDEGEFVGEQFMQWFLEEQVEEVSTMKTLLTVADRAGENLFALEDFVARELSASEPRRTPPRAAGGAL